MIAGVEIVMYIIINIELHEYTLKYYYSVELYAVGKNGVEGNR